MGIISRAEKKDERLKFKSLYETELNNRKMYEERYRQIEKQYRDLQEEKGIGELRKKVMQLADENEQLKAEIAKLKLETEDAKGFYEQEKQAKEYLLKERDEKSGEEKQQ